MSEKDTCDKKIGDNELYIPTYGIPYMNIYIYSIVEIVVVIFLLLNKALKLNFTKRNKNQATQRFYVLLVLLLIIIFGNIFTMATNGTYNICFDTFVKPIFFIMFK